MRVDFRATTSSLPLIIYLLLPAFYLVTGDVYYDKGDPHVKLSDDAILSGDTKISRDGRKYSSFMGIPFATIKHRFANSELIKDPTWEGSRDCTSAGPVCPQKLPFLHSFVSGDELNCLNLNVYVPVVRQNDDFPVMVWIHGGGFMFGSGSNYGAKYFMDEDIILVTINYRLGVFGFLSTGDDVIPGNNGLKDQVVALQWVQQNIQKFGGDPFKVTIAGQSAGGSSVHLLLLSPTTKNLFHRMISQSGSALSMWSFNPQPRKAAVALAEYLYCPLSNKFSLRVVSEEIKSCLIEKSVDELNQAQFEFFSMWPSNMMHFTFVPVSEHYATETPFLSAPPIEQMKDPYNFRNIPWMVGVTEDEGFLIAPSSRQHIAELNLHWDKVVPVALYMDRYLSSSYEMGQVLGEIREFYFGNHDQGQISVDKREDIVKMYSDAMFIYAVRKAAIETAARGEGNAVYLYEYSYNGLMNEVKHPVYQGFMAMINSRGDKLVGHGHDLFCHFDMLDIFPPVMNTELIPANSTMEEFSRNYVKLWASFAIQGKPTHTWGNSVDPKWTQISQPESDEIMPLNYYKLDKNPGLMRERIVERMKFWDKLWKQHFVHGMYERKH